MIRQGSLVWLPLSDIAREYNRHPEAIRQWCKSGFIIELGYSLRRDETGHWIVGVPESMYRNFSKIDTVRLG